MNTNFDKYSEYAALLNQCDKELDEIDYDYTVSHNLLDAVLWILYVYAIYDAKEVITQADIWSFWFYEENRVYIELSQKQCSLLWEFLETE